MRGKIALALVALAAGVAACGDSEDAAPLASVGAPVKTAPTRSPPTDPRRPCAAQGIDGTRLYEGSCQEGNTRFVIANRSGALRLESLVASIDRIEAVPEIGSGDAAVRPEQGAFLRFTLTVRNRREYPQNFEVGQTLLGIGQGTATEASEAELAHAESLAAQDGGRIEPGGTLRGDVLFDVRPDQIGQVASTGRLFVANFGERPGELKPLTAEQRRQQQIAEAIGGRIESEQQLGQMRLYAAPPAAAER